MDSETGISTTYYYDSINRPSGHRAYAPGSDHIVQFAYDKNNNVTYMTEITNDVSKYFSYTYDNDNRITSMNADGITVNYTYDSLGRLTRQMTKNGNTVILTKNTAYATSPSGKATAQISSYNGFTYTYDDNGNILSVSDGTNTTSYEYDSQNQLIRENNQALGKTWCYVYDDAGNRLRVFEYSYTTGSITQSLAPDFYYYQDSEWGDLLTAHGNLYEYDEVGNLLSDGKWTYTWEHGRQLASMSNGTTTWTYTYDANGMRTSRSNGMTTYQYYYTGDQLTVMTKGSTKLSFTHDAAGNPLTLTYNSTKYYYNTNLQGDVIGILDSSGATVVTYIYDAWGRPYSITGTLASTLGADNPLRYRGYVYDTETGLYYLQSRYYNPEWGRFISPEPNMYQGEFDSNAGLHGHNVYAYCANNPIVFKDDSGEAITLAACVIIGAIVGAVSGAVASKLIYGKVNGWWVLGGAAIGGVLGYVGGAFFGASGIKAGTLASRISMSKIRWLGRIGEKLSRLPKNTQRIVSMTKTAKYRIPDYLDKANKIIGDVKNVKRLSYTSQLKDFMLYAQKHGYTYVLKIRKTTQLSSTLKNLVDAGKIVLLYF